jgi:hypothetical protein
LPWKVKAVDHGSQVQTRTTHEQGTVAPCGDAVQDRAQVLLELGYRPLLMSFNHVEKVVRNLTLFVNGGLRRSDVEASIALHGVHRHQFEVGSLASRSHGQR